VNQGGLLMLLIKLSVEVSMFIGIIIGAFVVGLALRGAQIKKLKRKVTDLEKEMMASHAEILELHRDKLVLEEKLKGSSSIPVIPITAKEDKKSEKLQDKSVGKN
jgi:hypothetical protein